jgi:hypothetical protein
MIEWYPQGGGGDDDGGGDGAAAAAYPQHIIHSAKDWRPSLLAIEASTWQTALYALNEQTQHSEIFYHSLLRHAPCKEKMLKRARS